MARLDAFIEVLFKDGAAALVLETDSVAVLEGGLQPKPIMKRPLTTSHIIAAISELLPPQEAAAFTGASPQELAYRAPSGRVSVRFTPVPGGVRASIRPVTPDPEALKPEALKPEAPKPEAPKPEALKPEAARPEAPGVKVYAAFHAVEAPLPVPPRPILPRLEKKRSIDVAPAPEDAGAAMKALLDLVVEKGASDLHLTSDFTPCLRVDGDIAPLEGFGAPSSERLQAMLWSITPPANREQWSSIKDTDFAHWTAGARYRVNVFADKAGIGAVLRQIPNTILSAEQMGLSKPILDLAFLHKGLVLVTGPTGSGKSTTLAAIIDYINRNRDDHIITIEDPIEFVHPHKRCLVHQREVFTHTGSFKQALRAALREDPDIVLVGEMRDLETIGIALETAETGHLVFGTLHTNTAPSTVDRIIDQFPADRQPQVRTMLSESLKAVITQVLCKKIGGGRVPAHEILMGTGAVSNLIREGKTFQLPSAMQTGRSVGMQTMNDALLDLVKRKLVTPKEAVSKSMARAELRKQLEAIEGAAEVPPEEGPLGA